MIEIQKEYVHNFFDTSKDGFVESYSRQLQKATYYQFRPMIALTTLTLIFHVLQ